MCAGPAVRAESRAVDSGAVHEIADWRDQAAGWLLRQLELEAEGMTGKLSEISPWLDFTKSSWAAADGSGQFGWEEMPYWLKGYGDLAYVLKNEQMIARRASGSKRF
jgi:hypothetical protein